MNFYSHHIGDFNNATRHLTRMERSIYRDLLELYYDTEKPLTTDMDRLARRCLIADDERGALRVIIAEFFEQQDDGHHNKRADREIAAYQRMGEGGRRGAAKRWGKGGDNPPIATPSPPVAKANANHEPVTKNQEPVTKEKTKAQAPTFVLPDWINREHWDAWHSSPKRKKATAQQKGMAVAKLSEWRDAVQDYAGALENAALGGYQGLFLPDKSKPSATGETAYQRAERKKWEVATGRNKQMGVIYDDAKLLG